MIERASDGFAGLQGGKVAPRPTGCGNLLPPNWIHHFRGSLMSSLAIPSAVTATLPAVNVHPHGHVHRKGSPLDPAADSSSSTGAQTPPGSTQNLLGSLFNSLLQVIGARAVPAAAAAGSAAAAGGLAVAAGGPAAAAGTPAAAGSQLNVRALPPRTRDFFCPPLPPPRPITPTRPP